MKFFVEWTGKLFLMAMLVCLFCTGRAQSPREMWENKLVSALESGDPSLIKEFFSDDFGDNEIESWKYELKRGHLNFKESRLIRLAPDAVLVHIPTSNVPYDGDNHDLYFDFIYRIYKIDDEGGRYVISQRAMDAYAPDFLTYGLSVDVDTAARSFLFDSKFSIEAKSPHLLFKLAKDFEISDFRINGENAPYDRFGYFLHSTTAATGIHQIEIKGKLKSPDTNNQFMSMNSNSFFIRIGGFAAIPSPPPGNNGRNFFSDDSTRFNITYTYPADYTLLQYGDPESTMRIDGQKQTLSTIHGKWMDDIAFYAQRDWEKKEIIRGRTHIGFYYPAKDAEERDDVIAETDTLVRWINKKFNNYGNFKINFVVLNSFVKGGLLNDSHSIIAQNAGIIGSMGSWTHEICHSAPQPFVEGNYLWIKEGFTNFLSYMYLFSQKGEEWMWEDSKRKYLHYFDLYEEPLINIRSTSIPTYWAAYSKAAWIYRMLETETGQNKFQEALFKLGTMNGIQLRDSRSYMEIFEHISGKELDNFEEQWLCRKENPVLKVQGQLEIQGDKSLVKIRILQKEPCFVLPLELEIRTEAKVYRETVQVKGKETVFEKPVIGEEVSIKYDPESRLFAVIKENRKSFTESYKIPRDTATYVSIEGNTQVQVHYAVVKNGIQLIRKDENNASVLELSDKFSPVSYVVNGDTLFIQDLDRGTIQFDNVTYDIAEPVYPKEFIRFLFSTVNWGQIDRTSILYLIPGTLHCQVVHGELEKASDGDFEISLKEFLKDEQTSIKAHDGYPESINMSDGTSVFRK